MLSKMSKIVDSLMLFLIKKNINLAEQFSQCQSKRKVVKLSAYSWELKQIR